MQPKEITKQVPESDS
jgi:WD40 repeat protein